MRLHIPSSPVPWVALWVALLSPSARAQDGVVVRPRVKEELRGAPPPAAPAVVEAAPPAEAGPAEDATAEGATNPGGDEAGAEVGPGDAPAGGEGPEEGVAALDAATSASGVLAAFAEGPTEVSWEEPVKGKLPRYPDALEGLHGSAPIRCTVEADVDRKGMVTAVAVVGCPTGFHLAAATAVTGWRFAAGEPRTVATRFGFVRRERAYLPGVVVLADPNAVTADPTRLPRVFQGALPSYPHNVRNGDPTCTVEVRVDGKGRTARDVLVDGCPAPFRYETAKAVRKWTWTPEVDADGEGLPATVSFALRFILSEGLLPGDLSGGTTP